MSDMDEGNTMGILYVGDVLEKQNPMTLFRIRPVDEEQFPSSMLVTIGRLAIECRVTHLDAARENRVLGLGKCRCRR